MAADLLFEQWRKRAKNASRWELAWYLALAFCRRFYSSHGIAPWVIEREGLGYYGIQLQELACSRRSRPQALGRLTAQGNVENWRTGSPGDHGLKTVDSLMQGTSTAELVQQAVRHLQIPVLPEASHVGCRHQRWGASYVCLFEIATLMAIEGDPERLRIWNGQAAAEFRETSEDPQAVQSEHPGWFVFEYGSRRIVLAGDGRFLDGSGRNAWVEFMRGQAPLALAYEFLDALGARRRKPARRAATGPAKSASEPTRYASALDVAISAALAAGELLRDEFHRPGGPRGAAGKCPADEAAEAIIRDRLEVAFPDHGIVAEELGHRDRPSADPEGHLWLVDPNDGTSAFQRGWRGTAVSIALLRAGQPVLGVVYAYSARAGAGDLIAWAEGEPLTRNGQRISGGWSKGDADGATVLVSQDADRNPGANSILCAPARYRAAPSIAYRLALAAVGEGVAGVSLAGPTGWDIAAGQALLRSVGGELYALGGEPVQYARDGACALRGCVGGEPGFAHVLAQRDWSPVFGRPSAEKSPYGLVAPRPDRICADTGRLARAQGCLLGQLAGDNLGALVEFSEAAKIAAEWPQGPDRLIDGGHWSIAAGQPTDDSELALILARSILANGGYDPRAAASAYLHWYSSTPFDIGGTIGKALRAGHAAAARHADVHDALVSSSRANAHSQANGALMRISPLGIFGHTLSDAVLAEFARADATLSHTHPICQDANAVFVIAIAEAIRHGGAPGSIYERALAWAHASAVSEVSEVLERASHEPPATDAPIGWVLLALHHAFYHLLHAETPAAGIIETIRAGGDTDTTAAITGALLGAVHGIHQMPAQWIDRILTSRSMTDAVRTSRPRPEEFWPVDCLTIAEQLLCLSPARSV